VKSTLTGKTLLALAAACALLSPLAGEAAAQRRRGAIQMRGRRVIVAPRTTATTTTARVSSADPRLLALAERYSGDTFAFEARTPRGARVYAVNRPNAATLGAIDAGLSELFAVAHRHGYTARTSYTDYTIFIGRADRTRNSAGAYSPDVAIGAAQYAGSVYDQGGYVYAAGMVLSMEPCAFLIAEHERDFGRISNVARYEGEHIILYHNDRALYARTADHSRGGSHPILQ
jgi:hypothetical protein